MLLGLEMYVQVLDGNKHFPVNIKIIVFIGQQKVLVRNYIKRGINIPLFFILLVFVL